MGLGGCCKFASVTPLWAQYTKKRIFGCCFKKSQRQARLNAMRSNCVSRCTVRGRKKLPSTNVCTQIGQPILACTYAPCVHPYVTHPYIYTHKENNTAQRCRSQEHLQLFDCCHEGAKALFLMLLQVLFLH